jgi:hypothetical protein
VDHAERPALVAPAESGITPAAWTRAKNFSIRSMVSSMTIGLTGTSPRSAQRHRSKGLVPLV